MLNVVKMVRGSASYPITIAELKSAGKDLRRLLTETEIDQLADFLAVNPESGQVIPETGGVRKVRWAGQGKGKSKGVRVCYFYHDLNMPLFILAVYGKGETLRLTKREELDMAIFVRELKDRYRKKWVDAMKGGLTA